MGKLRIMSAALEVLKALRIAAAEVDAALLLLSLAQYATCTGLHCTFWGRISLHCKETAKPYSRLGLEWWVDIELRAYTLLDS